VSGADEEEDECRGQEQGVEEAARSAREEARERDLSGEPHDPQQGQVLHTLSRSA
jgi:hypothetical protein